MLDIAAEIEANDLFLQQKWQQLAKHPALADHPEYIEGLFQNGDNAVTVALAGNPAIASFPEIVENLVRYSLCWEIWEKLAANPAIIQYPDLIDELLDLPCVDPAHEGDQPAWAWEPNPLERSFAKNPALTKMPSLIERLRPADLAGNPAIASFPEIVEEIAESEYAYVRSALAANPAVASFPEIVKKLAHDDDTYVRDALSKNSALPNQNGTPHISTITKQISAQTFGQSNPRQIAGPS